jgi:hypothetical protein
VTRDSTAKPPDEACSAWRVPFAGLCDSSFMLEWPGSAASSRATVAGVSAKASLGTAYPKLAFGTAFPGPKVPNPASETRPYSSVVLDSSVVLAGRIRVQIFGSAGARDSRYGLPDSLFGSEIRRALQGVRCFPLVSALPCNDLRNLGEGMALVRMAGRRRGSDG